MDKESETAARQGFVGNAAAVAYAKGYEAGLKAAPCPVCGTNCSGCLEDLAAKQEGLRELLSHCRAEAENPLTPEWDGNARAVYEEIVEKLAPLLDGEA